jgi:hypothetical protein
MGGEPLPKSIRNALQAVEPSPPDALPISYRRLFREMVKGELEAGPLSASRRRELVRFAGRLKLRKPDARLLIRAVEYECGLATLEDLAVAAGGTRIPNHRAAELEPVLRLGLLVGVVLLSILVVRWVAVLLWRSF